MSKTCEIAVYNFCVLQNTRLSESFTWLNDDGTPVNIPVVYPNLKWSFFFPTQLDLTVGSGITISGDDSNVMTPLIIEETTEIIPPKRYYHELLMINASGINEYTLKGYVEVIETKTRIGS